MKQLDNNIDQINPSLTSVCNVYNNVYIQHNYWKQLWSVFWILYNRLYVSVVKQPKALLWHCVLYSNLSRGHGMYFLWTVTNDYHLSDKKSPWQRLYHSKTSRWVARIWSSIHIHYRVMWQNVTNWKWRHSKYWAGIN